MRKSAIIRQSGPYTVNVRPDGIVIIKPTWGQFPHGIPHIGPKMDLGDVIDNFLNYGLKGKPKAKRTK